jgi:hypothetical protein
MLPNESFERTARQLAFHQSCVVSFGLCVAGGQPLNSGVCAVHVVLLGGESPLSRQTWSRKTSKAQRRHRKVESEGSVERRCDAHFVTQGGVETLPRPVCSCHCQK